MRRTPTARRSGRLSKNGSNLQRVMYHGTQPATVIGAISRKMTDPMTANIRRVGSFICLGRNPEHAIEVAHQVFPRQVVNDDRHGCEERYYAGGDDGEVQQVSQRDAERN